MKSLFSYYNDQFYADQIETSLRSAQKYAKHLFQYYRPSTVVDVGCGRGAWLMAFKEVGATSLVGIDGEWNTQDLMMSPDIRFSAVNLKSPPQSVSSKFDLAISLETAEHLPKGSADSFINYLTQLSDIVLFSAAYTNQGGDNHINERPHSYWAEKFLSRNFMPYDLFRPIFWGDSDIDFCYQQNCFLYIHRNSPVCALFSDQGLSPLSNIDFLNCIHPFLYSQRSSLGSLAKRGIGRIAPSSVKPFLRSVLRILMQ